MASNVYFDANVLLEVVLKRDKESVARETLLQNAPDGLISTLTGHLVMHFGRKDKAIPALRAFLSDYRLLALKTVDFDWAFNNIRDKDFEDALQLAVAIRNGCDRFLTFDEKLYKYYKDLAAIEVELLK